ncbi:MAG TPA: hypothetical protein VGM25_08555 [Caulobacteraceae bacterium]
MRLIPALLIALALPALGACNQVYTRKPLLGEAREQGDPELRPGLWKSGDDTEEQRRCPFDIRKRLGDWPDCATALEVRRGQIFFVSRHERALAFTYRLVEGPPVLMQLHLSEEAFKDARVPEPKNTDNPMYGWTYAAITPTKTDEAARITEARMVQADCGPLLTQGAAPPAGGKPVTENVTSHPYAGLTIVGNNCVAEDLDTVENALAESARLKPPAPMRWIRDVP